MLLTQTAVTYPAPAWPHGNQSRVQMYRGRRYVLSWMGAGYAPIWPWLDKTIPVIAPWQPGMGPLRGAGSGSSNRPLILGAAGGWQSGWTLLVETPGLTSQISTARDDRGERPRPVVSGTFTCPPVDGVTVADVLRIDFVACAVPALTGLTGETVSITPHAGGELVPARITCRFEVVRPGGAG